MLDNLIGQKGIIMLFSDDLEAKMLAWKIVKNKIRDGQFSQEKFMKVLIQHIGSDPKKKNEFLTKEFRTYRGLIFYVMEKFESKDYYDGSDGIGDFIDSLPTEKDVEFE